MKYKMLFERRNELTELAKILTADNAELYEKRLIRIWAKPLQELHYGGIPWAINIGGKPTQRQLGDRFLMNVKSSYNTTITYQHNNNEIRLYLAED